MQGRRSAIHLEVDDQTRATFAQWLRRQKIPYGQKIQRPHISSVYGLAIAPSSS